MPGALVAVRGTFSRALNNVDGYLAIARREPKQMTLNFVTTLGQSTNFVLLLAPC